MPDEETLRGAPAQPGPGAEEPRIGVYTCYCGGNIGNVIDCERVADACRRLPNVVVSRTDMSMCSDIGQTMIEDDIRKHGVNRVVIGACAPSLHEQTFRGAVSRAGLNPYFYQHVGIREQDSWVHSHDHESATQKAIRLMSAGIAKARLLEPLEPIRLSAEKHALVIGGGAAGLRCALDLSNRGLKVTLVEKSPFLGGHVAQLEKTFPKGEEARALLDTLIAQVVNSPKITVHTYSEVAGVRGYVGDFQVQITQQSRGVDSTLGEAAMQACTIEVPDEFNYGLTKRKVVYQAYPGCYPPTPAVDWAHCPNGCLDLEIDGRQIKLENQRKLFDIRVGAVVVATGFQPYAPQKGEYGYLEHPEVLTLPQFIRLLARIPKGQGLEWNGRRVRNIGFIHCVGSRQIEGVHPAQEDGRVNNYCSRVCCTATLQAINELRSRYPEVNIVDVYEDIRTYGRGHEDYYAEASANRVLFLRFHGQEPAQVIGAPDGDESPLLIRVRDYLTWGEEVEAPVDMVVLAVGMMPSPVGDLVRLLKISPGSDRFLLEVHPKLRPVETAVPGVVLAGTAQGPMNIKESVAAASAAASKVAVLLSRGAVELEPFIARVNHDLCTGSGECVRVCAYEDAISLQDVIVNGKEVKKAVVTPANCVGCGACVSACPNLAIDLQGWTLKQFDAMVDTIVQDFPAMEAEHE
ncbi:MAG: CoB--CoM heterodisulfide reductase iron-sulfur subunit A family protein [Chloroflexota bacterium]